MDIGLLLHVTAWEGNGSFFCVIQGEGLVPSTVLMVSLKFNEIKKGLWSSVALDGLDVQVKRSRQVFSAESQTLGWGRLRYAAPWGGFSVVEAGLVAREDVPYDGKRAMKKRFDRAFCDARCVGVAKWVSRDEFFKCVCRVLIDRFHGEGGQGEKGGS